MRQAMTRRAALTVILALAGAGRATPLPPHLREPPWSRPVEGVEVRLTSKQPAYRAGEKVFLRLEIYNATDHALPLEEPCFHPRVGPSGWRGAPRESHGSPYPWRIVADPVDSRVKVRQLLEDLVRPATALLLLPPGRTHVVEITAEPRDRVREEEKELPREAGETQKVTLDLFLHHAPGKYRLRAVYRRDDAGQTGARHRLGRVREIETPPLEIEITPP